MLDIEVCKALQKADDDPRKPRAIDHAFIAESEANLKALIDLAKKIGLRPGEIKPISSREEKSRFSLYPQDTNLTLPAVVIRSSLMMLSLAEAHQCKYDGWVTAVMKQVS